LIGGITAAGRGNSLVTLAFRDGDQTRGVFNGAGAACLVVLAGQRVHKQSQQVRVVGRPLQEHLAVLHDDIGRVGLLRICANGAQNRFTPGGLGEADEKSFKVLDKELRIALRRPKGIVQSALFSVRRGWGCGRLFRRLRYDLRPAQWQPPNRPQQTYTKYKW